MTGLGPVIHENHGAIIRGWPGQVRPWRCYL